MEELVDITRKPSTNKQDDPKVRSKADVCVRPNKMAYIPIDDAARIAMSMSTKYEKALEELSKL
jgi:hypothetical protein